MIKRNPEHHHLIDGIAFLNAFISAISLFPQLYVLLYSMTARQEASALSYFLIFLNNIGWFAYGLHRKILPIVISSFLNMVASGSILFLIFK